MEKQRLIRMFGRSLNDTDRCGRTILIYYVIKNYNISCIKHILRKHPFLKNMCDNDGMTALMHASYDSIRDYSELIVSTLIAAGADVNIVSENKMCALMYAIDGFNSVDVVKLLIDAGTNTTFLSKSLVLAVTTKNFYEKRNCIVYTKYVKLLINAGADSNVEDENYENALYYGINMNLDVVNMLIYAGADINSTDCDGFPLLTCVPDLKYYNLLYVCKTFQTNMDNHTISSVLSYYPNSYFTFRSLFDDEPSIPVECVFVFDLLIESYNHD